MSKKSSGGGKANAQRSNAKNPNNAAYHHAQVNRGNQLNPQHAHYGGGKDGGGNAPKKAK